MPKSNFKPPIPSTPTSVAQAIDPNYWDFMIGAIVLMFVVFITAKGELATYIQLFFYVAPTSTTPTANPMQAAQTGQPVQGQNAAG